MGPTKVLFAISIGVKQMKNILVVSTGGTIACGNHKDMLSPSLSGEGLMAYVPHLQDICNASVLDLMSIDSSEMNSDHRCQIAEAIRQNANS